MPHQPRDIAVRIVTRLREAGHAAYLAGGCVRDELLGLPPKDYDVATDAHPGRVAELFRRTREVGKAFGVMLVHDSGVTVEVTTFRREGGYSDRRRPDHVEFADARADAFRRDFTINALYIDPLAPTPPPAGDELPRRRVAGVVGEVIDFVGGLDDLQRRVIRAVGDPDARLREDDLRALRAVRFAARLGFVIESATEEAVRRHAGGLAGVSRERIGDELRMMLSHPARVSAARTLEDLGLDAPSLAEPPRSLTSDRRLDTLGAIPSDACFALAASAWLIDRLAGAGESRASADRIASEGPASLARWRSALCLSNDERDHMGALLRILVQVERDWGSLSVARRKRCASGGAFVGALSLARARDPARAGQVERDVRALESTFGGLAPPPWVTGDHLVARGVKPGPGFGKWLDEVYDAQLEGRVGTPAQALELALRLADVAGT